MPKLPLALLAAPLTLFSAISAAPAVAEEADVKRITVSYSDLDLATVEGRERLTTRVKFAARSVCDFGFTRDLRSQMASKRCEAGAMRKANVKLASLFNGAGTRVADSGPVIVSAP